MSSTLDFDIRGGDDQALAEGLALIEAGVEKIRSGGLTPTSDAAAREQIAGIERAGRQVASLQLAALDGVDRSKSWAQDGHTSAKVFVQHVADLSGGEAAHRQRATKALRRLPLFEQAFADGEIGRCQVDRMARAFANTRIRRRLIEDEAAFLAHAKVRKYRWFDTHLAEWTRLADEDGAEQASERAERKRNFRLDKDFDSNWTIFGNMSSLDGAELSDIFDAFVDAEWRADWDTARALEGDDASLDDLPRSPAQRRADALLAMAKQAAATHPDANRPDSTTNLLIDHTTFERELAKLAGLPVEPDTPGREDFICETLSGHNVSPREAVLNALHNHIRRVVLGSDSVVIDQGRRQRLFTGAAKLAIWFSDNHCFHPSCDRHGQGIQADHTFPWENGGHTNPANGGPACGWHNRWKQTGYRVHRDQTGKWHTYRPNGTEIT